MMSRASRAGQGDGWRVRDQPLRVQTYSPSVHHHIEALSSLFGGGESQGNPTSKAEPTCYALSLQLSVALSIGKFFFFF